MSTEWQLRPLGEVARVEMGQSPPSEHVSEKPESGLAFLQGNAEFSDLYPHPRLWCSKPLKKAKDGDTLVSVRAPVGAINRADRDYCIGRGLAAIRFINSDPSYGYYALAFISSGLRKVAQGTTFEAVGGKDLRGLEFPDSPLPEQRRIAEILNILDEAIRKTEQVIAKLQQMKQGLLQDLLTRGIDDNGEVRDQERHPEQFKDTQLGWIPKGWDAVPASTLLLGVEQGWSPDCEAEPAEKGSWGVLKTTAVTWSRYDDSANKALPGHLRPRPEYEVKANDVLMTRAGPNSRVGVVALVTETQGRLMLSDKMYRLLPNTEKVSPEYLALALSGEKTQRHLATLKTGLAESQTNISQSIVLSLWIPLPGLAEQDRICDRHASLSRQAQLEALVLAKLLVLKKGLMNDLLTGRVRATINEEVGAA